MKNFLIYFSFLILIGQIVGCELEEKAKDIVSKPKLIASCEITDLTFDDQECLEFYEGFSGDTEDSCDSAQTRNFPSLKNHKDINSARTCPASDRSGVCEVESYKVIYYLDGYVAGAAQTECNSLSGTFTEP